MPQRGSSGFPGRLAQSAWLCDSRPGRLQNRSFTLRQPAGGNNIAFLFTGRRFEDVTLTFYFLPV